MLLSSIFSSFKKSKNISVLAEVKNYSIHQFKVTDLQGNDFDFLTLKGKKILIVNTASKCGLTPQYKKLQELYDTNKENNFVVVGFPSNDFLKQERGDNTQIESFCVKNYGVTFPMMEKIKVRGSKKHPIYQFLTKKSKNGIINTSVKWNFQKFLIDENGFIKHVISPRTSPLDKVIVDWITK